MRRALPFILLFSATTPAALAAGHAHLAAATHTHTFIPTAPIHTHAPSVFPHLNLKDAAETHTQSLRDSSLATFLTRTMLGFSSHLSH